MNWRERTAQILGNGATHELTKLTKAPSTPLLSVLSVPPPALFIEKDELPPDVEARRQRLLSMLEAQPSARLAVITKEQAGGDGWIVAIAIRDAATAELLVNRDRFDGVLLLELIERHTIH